MHTKTCLWLLILSLNILIILSFLNITFSNLTIVDYNISGSTFLLDGNDKVYCFFCCRYGIAILSSKKYPDPNRIWKLCKGEKRSSWLVKYKEIFRCINNYKPVYIGEITSNCKKGSANCDCSYRFKCGDKTLYYCRSIEGNPPGRKNGGGGGNETNQTNKTKEIEIIANYSFSPNHHYLIGSPFSKLKVKKFIEGCNCKGMSIRKVSLSSSGNFGWEQLLEEQYLYPGIGYLVDYPKECKVCNLSLKGYLLNNISVSVYAVKPENSMYWNAFISGTGNVSSLLTSGHIISFKSYDPLQNAYYDMKFNDSLNLTKGYLIELDRAYGCKINLNRTGKNVTTSIICEECEGCDFDGICDAGKDNSTKNASFQNECKLSCCDDCFLNGIINTSCIGDNYCNPKYESCENSEDCSCNKKGENYVCCIEYPNTTYLEEGGCLNISKIGGFVKEGGECYCDGMCAEGLKCTEDLGNSSKKHCCKEGYSYFSPDGKCIERKINKTIDCLVISLKGRLGKIEKEYENKLLTCLKRKFFCDSPEIHYLDNCGDTLLSKMRTCINSNRGVSINELLGLLNEINLYVNAKKVFILGNAEVFPHSIPSTMITKDTLFDLDKGYGKVKRMDKYITVIRIPSGYVCEGNICEKKPLETLYNYIDFIC